MSRRLGVRSWPHVVGDPFSRLRGGPDLQLGHHSLDALATCIRNQMPASGSNGYIAPTAAQQTDWRTVIREMLEGSCSATLPTSLIGIMQRRTFTDSANGRSYCLLMEVFDANNNGRVDRGWGTFIVYNAAAREVSHHAPHPISDSTTENQAIGVFRDTDSRSYLMAGAHRLLTAGRAPARAHTVLRMRLTTSTTCFMQPTRS
jgi:hypothetical protein